MGLSPDEIVSLHPSITLADVYAALAYYHDHPEEIRQQIREDEALAAEMQAQTPSLVEQKLRIAMPETIRFHLDENVSQAIAEGLRRHGIDITTTPEVGLMAVTDEAQVEFAQQQERVIFT